jgi:hypothetical protein
LNAMLPLITCEGGIKRLSLGRLTEQACAARWLIANDKVSASGETGAGLRMSVCRGCPHGARRAGDTVDPKVTAAIEQGKNPDAVLLGTRGGLKGGKARAAALSAGERSAAASNAASARWPKALKPGAPPPPPTSAARPALPHDNARDGHDAQPCKNKACSTVFVPRFALQLYCKPECSPSHYVPVSERRPVAPAPVIVAPVPKRDDVPPEAESAPTLDDIRDWLGARRGDPVEEPAPLAEQTQVFSEQTPPEVEQAPDSDEHAAEADDDDELDTRLNKTFAIMVSEVEKEAIERAFEASGCHSRSEWGRPLILGAAGLDARKSVSRPKPIQTIGAAPYTLRCGRFAIDCRSLEDLDAVVKRYGGEDLAGDGFHHRGAATDRARPRAHGGRAEERPGQGRREGADGRGLRARELHGHARDDGR